MGDRLLDILMGVTTEISWTDHTFNPWLGCTKVSAGCTHCYAETLAKRYDWATWGAGETRKRTSDANWRKPLAWNRAAEKAGVRRRVFCASLADVFDDEAPAGARADLWDLIRQCPSLDWQLLTKRPQNIAHCLPKDWGDGWTNVWLGISTEDQIAYEERWPILSDVPAEIRFISYEPAIGPLTTDGFTTVPDWVIIGGESGHGARTMNPKWARDLAAECDELAIPVFLKQWGTYKSNPLVVERGQNRVAAENRDPPSNGKGGALLDGRLIRFFPEVQLP